MLTKVENKKKNFGLSKTGFEELLAALKKGDESLVERVYMSHVEKCVYILMKKKGCTKEEAYDSTIEALLEIRKDLINDKIIYGNLSSYFIQRVFLKYPKIIRKKSKIKTQSIVNVDYSDDTDHEATLVQEEMKRLVAEAIEKLCHECRSILKQYYYEEANLNEIATKMKKTHSAVRKQATRCRDKLRTYIGKDFYQKYVSFF